MKEEAIKILTRNGFSGPSVQQCAEEWASKGHVITVGLVGYYKAYYTK